MSSTKDPYDNEDCWNWHLYITPKGYGRVMARSGGRLAHREIYMALVGDIPTGYQLDHLCRNRACVNPDHLEPVTLIENVRRSTAWDYWRNKKICKRGHAYNEENTRYYDGRRACKACEKVRQKRNKLAKMGVVYEI